MFCHQEWLNLPWNMGVSWVLQPTRTHSLNDENWISTGQTWCHADFAGMDNLFKPWATFACLRWGCRSRKPARCASPMRQHWTFAQTHWGSHICYEYPSGTVLSDPYHFHSVNPAGIPAQVAGEMQKSNWLGKGSDSHSERRYQEITSLQFPKQNISPTRDW